MALINQLINTPLDSFDTLVITHDNCVDGCACKALLQAKLNDTHEKPHPNALPHRLGRRTLFLSADHVHFDPALNSDFDALTHALMQLRDKQIYMADFCINNERILETLYQQNSHLFIYDHHQTTQTFLENFLQKRGIAYNSQAGIDNQFAFANTQKLTILFDCTAVDEHLKPKKNHYSATYITYQALFNANQALQKPIPKAIEYISDGDTWSGQYSQTEAFYQGLLHDQKPNDIPKSIWQSLFNDTISAQHVALGMQKLAPFYQEVQHYCQSAFEIDFMGHPILVAKAPSSHKSHVGNQLAKQTNSFSLIYDIQGDVVKCSLRSVHGVNVDQMAQLLGGGGHPNASAFRMSLEQFNQQIIEQKKLLKPQSTKPKI